MSNLMTDRNMTVKNKYSHTPVAIKEKMVHHVCVMKNLAKIRKSRKLSQTQLGEMAGCDQSMISKMENGTANPTLDVIESVAKALRVTPVALFGLKDAQQKAILAFDDIPDHLKEAAQTVLDSMAKRRD